MGKIRVQDLASRMGVEFQDLMFKLKSIGVRVDGDEAAIDSDIIHAILQGKKLPQPREVILRDDAAKAQVTRQPRRKPLSPLRPARRSMIHRVEPRIRELEVKKARPDHLDDTGASEPSQQVAHGPAAEAQVEVATTAAEAPQESGPAAQPKAVPTPVPQAPVQPPQPAAASAEPAAKAPPAEARPAAKPPAATRPAAKRPAAARPGPARPGPARPGPARPARVVQPRQVEAGRPPEIRPATPRRTESRPAEARPAAGRNRRPAPRRDLRRPAPGDRRAAPRAPAVQERQEELEVRLPVSERGRRRAQRRQEEAEHGNHAIQFKSDRPSGPVTITEGMTVRDFAEKLGVKSKDLIKALVQRGVLANINHVLDPETARSLAGDLGVEAMEVSFEEEVQLQHETELDGKDLEKVARAPVVTVMGHVDHGKTTLLDAIRSARVAEGEAGGITQHIGAYQVDLDGQKIVFLDTPGHEAFTLMRARGAQTTDIVVLVVAADDGVMPQTLEAIDHARAAEVPIVVAINKIDKANANLDRVRKELADHNLMVEDWGGDTVSVQVSALKQEHISDLLEMILLTADLLELKASPELPAQGVVLEARKETGRGIVATVLILDGTLQRGDVFVTGSTWGRVRLMTDDNGQRISSAGPATPVEVTGFTDVPAAGDRLQVMADESKARSVAEMRRDEDRQRELAPQTGRMSLEQLFSRMEQGEVKELSVVVKADVHGSVEVLKDTLEKLSTDKVSLKVIRASVGAITTNDVLFASASDAIVIGFNVRPERNAASLAEKEGVEIRLHTVIYELSDEIKLAMAGLLEPIFKEVHSGTADVRNIFKVPKVGVVAGCHITDGVIPRSAEVRLLRDNVVIYEGRISSLKRFKDDASEVRSGFDCGIGLESFQDIKPGDSIEAFTRQEVAPVL